MSAPNVGSSGNTADLASIDQGMLASMNAFTDAVQSGHVDSDPGTATPSPAREQADSRQPAPPAEAQQREEAAPPAAPAQEERPEQETPEGEQPAFEDSQFEPFTYRTDGREVPMDGISVFKDAEGNVVGATIDRDQLDNLRLRLGRHDHLVQENNRINGRLTEFDRFTHQGLDRQQYQGAQAFRQMTIENAQLAATVAVLARAIDDPVLLTTIVHEATNNLPPREYQLLQREMAVAARDAAMRAGQHWGTRLQSARDAAEMAPEALQGSLVSHFDSLKAQYADELKNLTDRDWQEARQTFAPFASQIIRRATAEDVQNVPELKLGQLIVDESKFKSWFSERVALRNQEAARAASNGSVNRENAARARAANAGKPAPSAPARRPAAAAPAAKADEGPSWQDIKNAWMQGRYVTDAAATE